MKTILRPTLLITVLLFSISTSYAQFDPIKGCVVGPSGECIPNTLLTAMPFLRIAPDARGGAMGDVGITLTPDPNAIHYNAANLAFAKTQTAFSLSSTNRIIESRTNNVHLFHFSGFTKISRNETIGIGFKYFSVGDINFMDPSGVISIGTPKEMEFNIAYARKLGENFAASFSAKYVYSNLATGQNINGIDINSAKTFAVDIGLTYKKNAMFLGKNTDWTFGLAITNFGPKVSYVDVPEIKDFLPVNLGLGSGFLINFDPQNKLSLHLEINKLLVPTNNGGITNHRQKSLLSGVFGSFTDAQGGIKEELKEFSISTGIEYWYNNRLAIRTGYFYEHPYKGDRQYISFGLGLNSKYVGVNLSYLFITNNRRNPLDNTLRFSLIFNFDGSRHNNADEK